MKIAEALQGTTRVFLDSAPVIYHVEGHPEYAALTSIIFDHLDRGIYVAITSPVTLAECLVLPYRAGLPSLIEAFVDVIVGGPSTAFATIGEAVARSAAELRAEYNLTLTDAIQIAVALDAGCEAFLTNDKNLRRVTELRVLVLDELEI